MDFPCRESREVHGRLHGQRTEATTPSEEEQAVLVKVMLDTTICISIIKRQPPAVLERFTGFAVGDVGISVITLAELEYGASKSLDAKRNRQALEQFIVPLEVARFDHEAAVSYGNIRATLEQKGRLIGAMDLLIAAHACSLGVRLATNNEREFKRVPGLRLENWGS